MMLFVGRFPESSHIMIRIYRFISLSLSGMNLQEYALKEHNRPARCEAPEFEVKQSPEGAYSLFPCSVLKKICPELTERVNRKKENSTFS